MLVRERPGDFLGFPRLPMLKVPPRGTLYKKAARKLGITSLLAFVESQLKGVSIIENFDDNLYSSVDKVNSSL